MIRSRSTLAIMEAAAMEMDISSPLVIDTWEIFPGSNRTNQGYGTLFHRRVLQEHGPSPVHRASFRPLADWITLSGSPVPSEKGVGF